MALWDLSSWLLTQSLSGTNIGTHSLMEVNFRFGKKTMTILNSTSGELHSSDSYLFCSVFSLTKLIFTLQEKEDYAYFN